MCFVGNRGVGKSKEVNLLSWSQGRGSRPLPTGHSAFGVTWAITELRRRDGLEFSIEYHWCGTEEFGRRLAKRPDLGLSEAIELAPRRKVQSFTTPELGMDWLHTQLHIKLPEKEAVALDRIVLHAPFDLPPDLVLVDCLGFGDQQYSYQKELQLAEFSRASAIVLVTSRAADSDTLSPLFSSGAYKGIGSVPVLISACMPSAKEVSDEKAYEDILTKLKSDISATVSSLEAKSGIHVFAGTSERVDRALLMQRLRNNCMLYFREVTNLPSNRDAFLTTLTYRVLQNQLNVLHQNAVVFVVYANQLLKRGNAHARSAKSEAVFSKAHEVLELAWKDHMAGAGKNDPNLRDRMRVGLDNCAESLMTGSAEQFVDFLHEIGTLYREQVFQRARSLCFSNLELLGRNYQSRVVEGVRGRLRTRLHDCEEALQDKEPATVAEAEQRPANPRKRRQRPAIEKQDDESASVSVASDLENKRDVIDLISACRKHVLQQLDQELGACLASNIGSFRDVAATVAKDMAAWDAALGSEDEEAEDYEATMEGLCTKVAERFCDTLSAMQKVCFTKLDASINRVDAEIKRLSSATPQKDPMTALALVAEVRRELDDNFTSLFKHVQKRNRIEAKTLRDPMPNIEDASVLINDIALHKKAWPSDAAPLSLPPARSDPPVPLRIADTRTAGNVSEAKKVGNTWHLSLTAAADAAVRDYMAEYHAWMKSLESTAPSLKAAMHVLFPVTMVSDSKTDEIGSRVCRDLFGADPSKNAAGYVVMLLVPKDRAAAYYAKVHKYGPRWLVVGIELPPDMMPTRFTASDALEVAKLFWEEKEVLFWWQLPHCLHDCAEYQPQLMRTATSPTSRALYGAQLHLLNLALDVLSKVVQYANKNYDALVQKMVIALTSTNRADQVARMLQLLTRLKTRSDLTLQTVHNVLRDLRDVLPEETQELDKTVLQPFRDLALASIPLAKLLLIEIIKPPEKYQPAGRTYRVVVSNICQRKQKGKRSSRSSKDKVSSGGGSQSATVAAKGEPVSACVLHNVLAQTHLSFLDRVRKIAWVNPKYTFDEQEKSATQSYATKAARAGQRMLKIYTFGWRPSPKGSPVKRPTAKRPAPVDSDASYTDDSSVILENGDSLFDAEEEQGD